MLSSSTLGGRYIVAGHTLIDIVVRVPTRWASMERRTRKNMVAATDAERRKQVPHRDRKSGTKVVSFALETYIALLGRSDLCLVECAFLASSGYARSRPSASILCTWFLQQVSIARRSLAHANHAMFLRGQRGEGWPN